MDLFFLFYFNFILQRAKIIFLQFTKFRIPDFNIPVMSKIIP